MKNQRCWDTSQVKSLRTRWFVRKLSTCLSQHAAQISLQINLMASSVSENSGLSRHSLFVYTLKDIDMKYRASAPFGKVGAYM